VKRIVPTPKTQTPIPRESPAEALKRRVYIVIVLLGLPGIYTAWFASRSEQPFMAVAYICLGVGVLFGLVKLLNPRVSVVWAERYGFVLTVMIVLANLIYSDYIAAPGPILHDARETSHWLIAYLCVLTYVVFDTRTGLRIASTIAAVAFALGWLGIARNGDLGGDSGELLALVRYTSISTAMLAFTYLLAYSKEQLNVERVRSSTDDLTGLANRRALYAILETQIVAEDHVAVILLDVDRFKNINDTFGHAAGDEVLIGFADLLRHHVPNTVSVGRWGGEEFLIVLPKTNLEAALAQAEKVRLALEHRWFDVGQVTASFGVACLQPDESLSDLVRRADLALYAAKSRGRNRVEHHVRVLDQLEDGGGIASDPSRASVVI
jgi:diguanylate cyclase (GGDEF)-like protein